MGKEYIFISKRLGFRNWKESDTDTFVQMNKDAQVMEHFPNFLTETETKEFIQKLKNSLLEKKYTYFAVEVIKTKEFIGFIGLGSQDYESKFTPAIDIGWRLKKTAWGKGYATEGAEKCLDYAFNQLKFNTIISICTEKNLKSESVMKKIGMKMIGEFNHPRLSSFPDYEKCICYQINNPY